MKLTAKTQREGRNILDHGNLAMTGVSRGYLDNMSNTPVCSFQFRGKEKRYGSPSPVHVRLLLGRSMVQSAQCDCYTCSTKYYWSGEKNCPFISAALDLVSDYQSQDPKLVMTIQSCRFLLWCSSGTFRACGDC